MLTPVAVVLDMGEITDGGLAADAPGDDCPATIACILSTLSFVPQVVKAWQERDTTAISKPMVTVTVTAFVLWSTYGYLIDSWPMMVFNLMSLGLSGAILVFKIRNDRRKSRVVRSCREPGMVRSG
jgi:MtN3 and saliva related transmembrane protein